MKINMTGFTSAKVYKEIPQQVRDEKIMSEAVPEPRQDNSLAAFTLAEVLITLAIIGVVAAVTIPTLINKYQEKQIVTQLTKEYSTLSQAWQMMQAEYGTIDTWGLSATETNQIDPETGKSILDFSGNRLLVTRLVKYLKVSRICKQDEICDENPTYSLSGILVSENRILTAERDGTAFYLADGTLISFGYHNINSRYGHYGDIVITLPSKKHILGLNSFYFVYTPKGIVPKGHPDYVEPFDTACSPDLQTKQSGRGCAAWIIYNKNMDYLHCRDKLSWNGKHSCNE